MTFKELFDVLMYLLFVGNLVAAIWLQHKEEYQKATFYLVFATLIIASHGQ